MSLIAELKRRNVFRVGVAYAIVGWLLVEVARWPALLAGLVLLPSEFSLVSRLGDDTWLKL